MTDDSDILATLTERNRIRSKAQLPLLDVSVEYEFAIAERDWWEEIRRFDEVFDLVRREAEEILWENFTDRRRRTLGDHTYVPQRTGLGGWGNRLYIQGVLDRIVRRRFGARRPNANGMLDKKFSRIFDSGSFPGRE